MFNKIKYLYIFIIGLSIITNLFVTDSSFAKTTEDESNLSYKEGELIVRFMPKHDCKQRSLSEKNQILNRLNAGTIKGNSKIVPGLTLVKLTSDLTVEKALQTFKNIEEILYVQPNYCYKNVTNSFPNDSDFNNLWGLHNTGQSHPVYDGGYAGTPDADIDAPEVWDIIHDACDIKTRINTDLH